MEVHLPTSQALHVWNKLNRLRNITSRRQTSWLYTSAAEELSQGLPGTNPASGQGPVSRKSRELFGPEKPFVKVRPAYSAKLVFSYVVKGVKIKITAKFRASRLFRFEDTKRIMSPEIRPKSFGTFEKQAPEWDLNSGSPDFKSGTLTTLPPW